MEEDCVKGLINNGKNNCFLNVICQSLWNLYHVKTFLFNNNMHKHSKTHIDEESNNKITQTINQFSLEYKDKLNEYVPKSSLEIDSDAFQDNCLQCVLFKFFSNYFTSSLKSLDVEEIRKVLINLNNSIQKFSKSGVNNKLNKMSCSTETLEEMILYFHRSYLFYNYSSIVILK